MLFVRDSPVMRIMGRFGLARGSLRAASLSGAFWTTLGYGHQFALRLVSTMILTRLLAPEVFGLLSLASVFLIGLYMFSDIGVRPSVVRSHREDPAFLQTAWTMQMLRASLVALCTLALAWPASRIYGEPVLLPMLLVMALIPAIDGFTSIAQLIAQRRLELRRLTLIGMGAQTVSTVCTIALAWILGSIWGLVIGSVLGTLLNVAASFLLMAPFPHAFRLERQAANEIIRFGVWIFLATLLSFAGGQGATLLQGMLVPVEMLGLIALANNITGAPSDLINRLAGSVLFPAVSQIARDRPEDLRRTVGRFQLLLLGGSLPMFLLLAWGSGFIIDLMYDDRYAQAAEFLSILTVGSAFSVLSIPYQNTILAIGDSRTHSVMTAALAVLRIAGMLAGYQVLDVWGMLAGLGLGNALAFLVFMWVARARGFANLGLDAVALTVLSAAFAWIMVAHVPA